MKKITLLILGLSFFIFVNFSFAAGKITPFNWDKMKNPEELIDCNEPSARGATNKQDRCPRGKDYWNCHNKIADEYDAQVKEYEQCLETRQAQFQNMDEIKKTAVKVSGLLYLIHADGTKETLGNISSPKRIMEGDEISTYSAGYAIITFYDGSYIFLDKGAKLKFNKLGKDSKEAILKLFELLDGKVRAKVYPWGEKGNWMIEMVKTPSAIITEKGTDFVVAYDPATNITNVYLYEGLVDVDNLHGKTTQLQPGETISVDGNGQVILEKLSEEQWTQLTNEMSFVENSEQTVQSDTAEQGTTVQPPAKKLAWFGLIAVLFGIAGVGFFIYRKKY